MIRYDPPDIMDDTDVAGLLPLLLAGLACAAFMGLIVMTSMLFACSAPPRDDVRIDASGRQWLCTTIDVLPQED